MCYVRQCQINTIPCSPGTHQAWSGTMWPLEIHPDCSWHPLYPSCVWKGIPGLSASPDLQGCRRGWKTCSSLDPPSFSVWRQRWHLFLPFLRRQFQLPEPFRDNQARPSGSFLPQLSWLHPIRSQGLVCAQCLSSSKNKSIKSKIEHMLLSVLSSLILIWWGILVFIFFPIRVILEGAEHPKFPWQLLGLWALNSISQDQPLQNHLGFCV